MRFIGRCTARDPAWSFAPLSSAGAAPTGGRFNQKGEPTLYLSLDIMTSLGEFTQGFSNRMQPLTMGEYDIYCEPVADLRDDSSRLQHGVACGELDCPWLSCLLAGRAASSWVAAERMRSSGHGGMIVPSFVPGATDANLNLV